MWSKESGCGYDHIIVKERFKQGTLPCKMIGTLVVVVSLFSCLSMCYHFILCLCQYFIVKLCWQHFLSTNPMDMYVKWFNVKCVEQTINPDSDFNKRFLPFVNLSISKRCATGLYVLIGEWCWSRLCLFYVHVVGDIPHNM